MQTYKRTPLSKLPLQPFSATAKGLCASIAAFLIGALTARWLIPVAYAKRGYPAIGGEWLVVILVVLVAFCVGRGFLKKI